MTGIATNDDAQTTRTTDAQSLSTEYAQNSPSLRIVAAVSDAIDADPTSIPPLYDTVDPEALDRLLDAETAIEVVFEYEGHAVEITGDGTVTVDGVEREVGRQ